MVVNLVLRIAIRIDLTRAPIITFIVYQACVSAGSNDYAKCGFLLACPRLDRFHGSFLDS